VRRKRERKMAGIGFPELIVICIIALLLFGPSRLPEAGRALGQAIRGFRSSMDGKEETAAANRGGTACGACGHAVPVEATFCPSCGKTVAKAPPQA
jgi:sec-independent protein translocase protein TatA